MNILNEIQVSYKTDSRKKPTIDNANTAYQLFLKSWNINNIEFLEEFKVMFLNQSNKVLGLYSLSKGGINQCTVDIRHIYSIALKVNASAIIVAHNHPSGNLKPSREDLKITSQIAAAGEILNIKLLDHLIITKNDFLSIEESGLCAPQ